jgi:hypothetical protein
MLMKSVRPPRRGEVAPSGRSSGNSRKAIPKPEHSSPPDSRSGPAPSVRGSEPSLPPGSSGPTSIPTISPSPSSPRYKEAYSSPSCSAAPAPWTALSTLSSATASPLVVETPSRTYALVDRQAEPRCWQGQAVPPRVSAANERSCLPTDGICFRPIRAPMGGTRAHSRGAVMKFRRP